MLLTNKPLTTSQNFQNLRLPFLFITFARPLDSVASRPLISVSLVIGSIDCCPTISRREEGDSWYHKSWLRIFLTLCRRCQRYRTNSFVEEIVVDMDTGCFTGVILEGM